MEVLRLGVQPKLQLLAHTTAMATPDPSRICNLSHSSHGIHNPLSEARAQTCILTQRRVLKLPQWELLGSPSYSASTWATDPPSLPDATGPCLLRRPTAHHTLASSPFSCMGRIISSLLFLFQAPVSSPGLIKPGFNECPGWRLCRRPHCKLASSHWEPGREGGLTAQTPVCYQDALNARREGQLVPSPFSSRAAGAKGPPRPEAISISRALPQAAGNVYIEGCATF